MNATGIKSYSACVEAVLEAADTDRWRLTTANPEFLSTVVNVVSEAESVDTVLEVLCGSPVLKALERDFLLSTKANDLVASDVLTVRERGDTDEETPTLLTSPDQSIVFLPVGGREAVSVPVREAASNERLWDRSESAWNLALPYSFDSPPYSRMLAIADDILGSALRADLDLAYSTLESRGPDERPDPVTIALLVGAKHELLVSDIVSWTERTDLATQGMVSKLKTDLESMSLVETESERVGVGRPRQRLKLTDEGLASLSGDELLAQAQSVLN